MVAPGVRDRNYSREVFDAQRREKLWRILKRPYRKPTQVDGMSILRPTGEGLSRNSANWTRNFGRRGRPQQ